LESFQDFYPAFFILLMVFIHTEIAEVLGLMMAPKSYSQVQPLLGAMNENRNKDSSIYHWIFRWSWALGFNLDNFINSQLT
jgi:hypothetical protein